MHSYYIVGNMGVKWFNTVTSNIKSISRRGSKHSVELDNTTNTDNHQTRDNNIKDIKQIQNLCLSINDPLITGYKTDYNFNIDDDESNDDGKTLTRQCSAKENRESILSNSRKDSSTSGITLTQQDDDMLIGTTYAYNVVLAGDNEYQDQPVIIGPLDMVEECQELRKSCHKDGKVFHDGEKLWEKRRNWWLNNTQTQPTNTNYNSNHELNRGMFAQIGKDSYNKVYKKIIQQGDTLTNPMNLQDLISVLAPEWDSSFDSND